MNVDLEDEFAGVADLVGPGGRAIHSVRIVEWVDDNGESHIQAKVDGTALLSTTIGVLDTVKHWYLHEATEAT
jgi:hypothetical protein